MAIGCSTAGERWRPSSTATPRTSSWRSPTAGSSQKRRSVPSSTSSTISSISRPTSWPLVEPGSVERPGWSPADRGAVRHRTRGGRRRGDPAGLRTLPRDARGRVLPQARPDDRPGLAYVPGGPDAYRRLIRAHTSLDLTPEEIHAIGLAEVERIDAELEASAAGAILGTRDRAEAVTRLRTDPASTSEPRRGRRTAPSGPGPGERGDPGLVRDAAARHLRGRRDGRPRGQALDDRLLPPTGRGRQPTRPLLPQHDASRRRARATRPRRWPSTRPSPGTTSSSRSPRSSTACRPSGAMPGTTAFIEGWGLYTERLSDEMGLYSGDLDRIGIASFDAWRACRLVVDTGDARARLAARPGHRLHARAHRPRRRQHRQRGRPIHRLARPGAGLQARPARDPAAARRGPCARSAPGSTSGRSTTPCCATARCRCRRSGPSSRRAHERRVRPSPRPPGSRRRRSRS